MKAQYIKENFGGAGFSMSGGMGGRGGGFGGASNMGGPNMMYVYEIKPLNSLLTQKQPKTTDYEEIHMGMSIKGKKLNDPKGKFHKGHIIKIVKSETGALKYYEIMNQKGQLVKINPTSALIINNLPDMEDLNLKDVYGDEPLEQKSHLKESFLMERLEHFRRGIEPKDAMGTAPDPDLIPKLVKIINEVYLSYSNGLIHITEKGTYKDVDGNTVPKKEIIPWVIEMLEEVLKEEYQCDLTKEDVLNLLEDIKNRRLSKEYPGLNDDIPIYEKW